MSNVRRLYELQEIDLAIRDDRRSISDIEGKLQDDSSLLEAKTKLEEEEKHLSDMRKTEKQLDWDIEELSVKMKDVDKQLYGGSVKNPKDLASLNEELEHFKQRRSVMEDGLLDLMTDLEEQQRTYDHANNGFKKAQVEWQENNGHLVEDRNRLNGEIAELEGKREEVASQIDQSDLGIYERLRRTKGGEAMSIVEQGMCKGCRINLPTHTLQKVRTGQELIYCTNCGRILCIS
ncbi:zinc ribbon domain-containing protein [Chloroflexota bacterium]